MARSTAVALRLADRGRGRGDGLVGKCGPAALAARFGKLRLLGVGGDLPEARLDALGEREGLGISLQLADGVGTTDGVGLPEQVVGQTDVGVGVRAADLRQGRASALADLVRRDAEQAGDVLIALSTLAEKLQQRPLVPLQRHRGSLCKRRDGRAGAR